MSLYPINLEIVDYIQGAFSLLFVIISLIIGITILSKYFEYKRTIFILMGISWIGLASPYFPDSISFILILTLNIYLPIDLYLIIGNVLLPFFLLIWIWSYSELLLKEKQPYLLILFLAIAIIFEIVFFNLFFTDISLIGSYERYFQIEFGEFITIALVVFDIILLITGLHFALDSFKSTIPEIKLKGKLLLAAFISFSIGAALDASIGLLFEDPLNPFIPVFVVLSRLILISSAFEFYGGFILPKWMEQLFMRK